MSHSHQRAKSSSFSITAESGRSRLFFELSASVSVSVSVSVSAPSTKITDGKIVSANLDDAAVGEEKARDGTGSEVGDFAAMVHFSGDARDENPDVLWKEKRKSRVGEELMVQMMARGRRGVGVNFVGKGDGEWVQREMMGKWRGDLEGWVRERRGEHSCGPSSNPDFGVVNKNNPSPIPSSSNTNHAPKETQKRYWTKWDFVGLPEYNSADEAFDNEILDALSAEFSPSVLEAAFMVSPPASGLLVMGGWSGEKLSGNQPGKEHGADSEREVDGENSSKRVGEVRGRNDKAGKLENKDGNEKAGKCLDRKGVGVGWRELLTFRV